VLQKHEEKTKERSFTILLLCLNGHSEQFCDELHLPQAISFAHSLRLSFLILFMTSYPWNVRQAVSKEKKPMPGLTRRLMRTMVLFDEIVEIFALSEFTR